MNFSSLYTQNIGSPFQVAFDKETQYKAPNVTESFGKALTKALGEVNDLQLRSDKAIQTMITDPGKINIHDITTLLSQSEMALSMTKAVTDRVINAYREITSLR